MSIRKQIFEFRLTGEMLAKVNGCRYEIMSQQFGRLMRLEASDFLVINSLGMSSVARKPGSDEEIPYKACMQIRINTTVFFLNFDGSCSPGPSNLLIPLKIRLKEFVTDDSVTYKVDTDRLVGGIPTVLKDGIPEKDMTVWERREFFEKVFKGGSVDFADFDWDIYVYPSHCYEFILQFVEGSLKSDEYIDVAIGYTLYAGSDGVIANQLATELCIPVTMLNVEWLKRQVIEHQHSFGGDASMRATIESLKAEKDRDDEKRKKIHDEARTNLRKQRVVAGEK